MDHKPRPFAKSVFVPALRRLMRWRKPASAAAGFAMVLDRHVPVIYTGRTVGAPLGIAQAAQRCPRAVVLVFLAWSVEEPEAIEQIRQDLLSHRLSNPGHTVIFLCNTAREAELLVQIGENAILLNHNAFVSDYSFRPLDPRPILYDAVYNARLTPFKRHELTLDIASCAFIYYQAGSETNTSDAALRKRHATLAPGHAFINRLKRGKPVRLNPREVNDIYNQSAVGLCLSAIEGAMFASMEYMLAGLPVVSTPSLGGRDVYFDDEYCIVARPDPRDIRDAVAALKTRAIPREFIATRTREKVGRDRARLEALLDALRDRDGRPLPARDALFGPGDRVEWRPWQVFLDRLAPTAFD